MATRAWSRYGVAAGGVLLFIWLGRATALGQTLPFDNSVREFIHIRASHWLTLVMRSLTQMGEPAVLVLVTLAAGWRLSVSGKRRAALVLVFSTVGITVVSETLKVVFRRGRPPAFFGYDEPLTYSYPSGHALVSICFYGLLALILSNLTKSAVRRRAVWTISVVLVALIGFSRVYLGVHYPTDVLGGYLLGGIWLAGVRRTSYWR